MKQLLFIYTFLVVSFAQAQQVLDFKVLENPFHETCNLQFKVVAPSVVSLMIYDIYGQEVYVAFSHTPLSASTYIISIPSEMWADGVYFTTLKEELDGDESTSSTLKLVRSANHSLSITEAKQQNPAYFDAQNSCIRLPENDQLLDAYLVNMNGQVLARNSQVTTSWALENLPNGMYVATFLNQQKVVYQVKFVK